MILVVKGVGVVKGSAVCELGDFFYEKGRTLAGKLEQLRLGVIWYKKIIASNGQILSD
ncbi:hypothetical protein [Streptococcus pantholopis]|uniref:hypothetical protein n=1 Tax=Streptococcus pantholopis TaxID=1811193 RepID=UPI000AD1AC56|nr:hypothetical protein [Streptococcus pantholopis]